VAVLRFNRRSPVAAGRSVSLNDQAADGLAALDTLAAHLPRGDLPVGFWGWSQGAWVAALGASRSAQVGFLVLVACTGVSPAVQMRYGTAEHLRASGFTSTDRAHLRESRLAFENSIRGTVSRASAQRVIDRYVGCEWFHQAWVPRKLPAQLVWEDMDYDPIPSFERIVVPTLLFYGESDEWSPIGASLKAWSRARRVSRNKDVSIVRLAGTKHAPTIGGRMTTRAISPEYSRSMTSWLEDHLPRKDGAPGSIHTRLPPDR
jgi:uncharacterized protein